MIRENPTLSEVCVCVLIIIVTVNPDDMTLETAKVVYKSICSLEE